MTLESKFILSVRNSDGRELQFYAVREVEDSTINYYFGNPQRYNKSCVHISIYKDMQGNVHGQIDHLLYEASCTIDNNMKAGDDTTSMLKGALKYVAKLHPNVSFYSLNDEADKLINKRRIMITPRILLQGKPGWYQHRFGAQPAPKTQRLLQVLETPDVKKKINEYLHVTTMEGWGDHTQIMELAPHILPKSLSTGYLWGTEWHISRKVAVRYDVSINTVMSGGTQTDIRRLYHKLSQKRIYLKRV